MKHLILLCSLLSAGLSVTSLAQNADENEPSSKVEVITEKLSEGGIKIGVNFDDEDSTKNIENFTEFLYGINDELGQEFEAEFDELSNEDKKHLAEKFDDNFPFGSSSNDFPFNSDSEDFPIGLAVVASLAVTLIFGMPLFLLIAILVAGHRKRRQKMDLVDLYIKSDRDIPEHVMTGLDNGGSASSLKSGLTLTAVGIGIVAALNIAGGAEGAGFGLIPMFLGIARLTFWFLVERKVEPSA